jgi:predicted transcriptional regulator
VSGGRPPRAGLLGPAENAAASQEIRRLRLARGLTQVELAALLYQSAGWVTKRETGGAPLTRSEVMRVCAVLHGLDHGKQVRRDQ